MTGDGRNCDQHRRRVLGQIVRVAAGGALVGLLGLPPVLASSARAGRLYRWSGVALGGTAHLWVEAADRAQASELVRLALAEKARLERIFSLYRRDSALARLNARGLLKDPPPELVELLGLARNLWEASDGAFDPTVQPLYEVYVQNNGMPTARQLDEARTRTGMSKIALAGDGVRYGAPGMALTLNGIAQGYISDRVAEVLARAGCEVALVQFGEIRALGRPPGRTNWPVLLDEGGSAVVEPRMPAMAVTDTMGTRIGSRAGHVFDPRRGCPIAARRRVAVFASSAALADGLATALGVLGPQAATGLLAAFPQAQVRWLGLA